MVYSIGAPASASKEDGRQAQPQPVPEGRQAGKAAASTSHEDGRQARQVIDSLSVRCVCVQHDVVCVASFVSSH